MQWHGGADLESGQDVKVLLHISTKDLVDGAVAGLPHLIRGHGLWLQGIMHSHSWPSA